MQQMEISDYINNEQPRPGQKHSEDAKEKERRLCQLLLLSFGVLCVIQATLNVALRLTLHTSENSTPLDCNVSRSSVQNQRKEADCEGRSPGQHKRLQERLIALTRDRSLLEKHNTDLTNKLKVAEEENTKLEFKITELSGHVSSQKCPADWMEINSRCYFLSTERKTWDDSRRYCLSKDADLVVINSEREQRALYCLDGNVDLISWIGLYDTAGTFKWVDGSALTRPFWQSYQSDLGGEVCVEMYHFLQVLASWNKAPCETMQRWMCEKDPFTSS